MEKTSAAQPVLDYVAGWIAGDRERILQTLAPDCIVIESYGPTYRGKEMVGQWIDAWLAPGNTVDRWDITSLHITDEVCFFEWVFECTYNGSPGGFEGASLARLSQGKIVSLREYALTAPRYEWQGTI